MSFDSSFEISPANIHIWLIRLVATESAMPSFQHLLAPEEMSMACRFKFRRLRENYILSRGSLRFLLARYLDVSAQNIRFRYGPRGKPHLLDQTGIEFNVSHSGELAAFAFCTSDPVGVDVEQIRRVPEMDQIAKRFFSLEEHDELLKLPLHLRDQAFFLCWTRKEAYIKAVGEGLHIPLRSFRVTLHPDHPVELVGRAEDRDGTSGWKLHDLAVGPGHAGALAYSGTRRKVIVHSCIRPSDLPAICISRPFAKRLA